MRPHAQHLDAAFRLINLIHQTMLNVDASRIRTGEVADQFFVRGWVLEWILLNHIEQPLRLDLETCGRDFFSILLRLTGINHSPTHQPGFFNDLDSGSAIPLRMDARIPGIDTR